MKQRDKLKIKFNKSGRSDTLSHEKFKSLKNNVTSLVRKSKIQYFNSSINSHIKNPRKFWAAVKKLCIVGTEENDKVVCSPDSLNKCYISNNNAAQYHSLIDTQINNILNTVPTPIFNLHAVT